MIALTTKQLLIGYAVLTVLCVLFGRFVGPIVVIPIAMALGFMYEGNKYTQ